MSIQRTRAASVIHLRHFMLLLSITAALMMVCCPNLLYADWTITQTISLKTGWNSVFLEVCPVNASPDVVFKGLPVDKVLTFYPTSSSVQYIQEPTETPWNQTKWHFWVPQDNPSYALRNLFSLQANQAYLIRCTQDYQWQVAGTPQFYPFRWQPNSFNLTGFRINDSSHVSFENYFGDIQAFTDTTIAYLNNGNWVQSKMTDTIKPKQAYWVYCKGAANYGGPMYVWLPSPGDRLWFTQASSELEIKITNQLSSAASFTIEAVPTTAGDPPVPLSIVTYSPTDGKTYTPFTTYTPQNPLPAGKSETIRFAVRRGEITTTEVKSLLKLSGSLGDRMFIPVSAEKITE